MINLVLFEPEIPQNTGNIARTCAVTGCRLHLIKPLGFDISDKAVKRAGLDYWHLVDLHVYENLEDFFQKTGAEDLRLLACFRQGDGGAARGVPGTVPGALHPYSHSGRHPMPQSLELCGYFGI